MPQSDAQVLVVLVTCPKDHARDLARTLIEERLAACVNRIPGLTSVYRWEGKVAEDEEVLLMIKTTAQGFPKLRDRVLALHPYDLPEILALGVEQGLPGYLAWVAAEVSG